MNSSRNYIFLFVFCIFLALPAAGVNVLYYLTKDPSLRPLGITREKMAEVDGQTEFISIFVHVDWGRERTGGTTKADLRQMVSDAFFHRTDDYIFKFKDVPGDEIGVTFVIGPNRYGPYPPSRIIEGIVPALVALDMTKKARGGA